MVKPRSRLVDAYNNNFQNGELDKEGFAEEIVDLRYKTDREYKLDDEIGYTSSDRVEDEPDSPNMAGVGLMLGGAAVLGMSPDEYFSKIIGGASMVIGAGLTFADLAAKSGSPNEILKERAKEWGDQYTEVKRLEGMADSEYEEVEKMA